MPSAAARRLHSAFRAPRSALVRRRPRFESLESRSLLAGDIDISISDATATNGKPIYLGNLVAAAGGLYNPAMMTYGPDGHLYVATSIESSNPPGSPQRFGFCDLTRQLELDFPRLESKVQSSYLRVQAELTTSEVLHLALTANFMWSAS